MSSWEGFTERLRRHARSIDVKPTARGYLNVAADRIEELEDKLVRTEFERDAAKESVRKINR